MDEIRKGARETRRRESGRRGEVEEEGADYRNEECKRGMRRVERREYKIVVERE